MKYEWRQMDGAGTLATTMVLDKDGILSFQKRGTILIWTKNENVSDDGTFNLPAITDSAFGWVAAGNNEEYALFGIDNDGDVTLISNSSNVVANADTDGNLCIGTAATQEPLTIKNRLAAAKDINLFLVYS